MLVKTLTADDKHSSGNMQNFPKHFQTPLSQKQKIFLDSLNHFWHVHEIWSIFKKKMSILA